MPEVTVRKRTGRRSGGVRYRVRRWLYYRRAHLAVGLAGLITVIGALALWTLLQSTSGDGGASAEAPAVVE